MLAIFRLTLLAFPFCLITGLADHGDLYAWAHIHHTHVLRTASFRLISHKEYNTMEMDDWQIAYDFDPAVG